MRDTATDNVLSRKAQAARRAREARGMSAEKALRRALARTAEDAWNLALIARDARIAICDQDDLAETLEVADQLILLFDGPEGALGFACLDREAVTALVEVQTLGIVTDLPPEDRPLTPTDAAMSAPLVEGALARLADYLHEEPLSREVADFRFGAMIDTPRTAINLLAASAYHCFEAALDLGGGRRNGRIAVALPDLGATRAQPHPPEGPPRHEDFVLTLPARIDAVLCRLRVPFSTVEGLAPGTLLPLPATALDMAELMAGSRHVVTRGRLGQLNGHRAIRVTEQTGAAARAARLVHVAAAAEAEAAAPPAPPAAPRQDREVTQEPPTRAEDVATAPPPATADDDGEEFELPDLPPLDFDAAMTGAEDGGGEDAAQSRAMAMAVPEDAHGGNDID